MDDLYIVYGSESKLLKKIFFKKKVFFIRIFNKKKPLYLSNSYDFNSYDQFIKNFEKIFNSIKPKRIIFVGAAFEIQNSLLISEKVENIETMINTNILNYVKFTHFILPYMMKIRSGNFIFLSSFKSQTTSRGVSIYSASKSFCENFYRVIGKEYGLLGIYSNSIRLGCFDGKMFNSLSENKKTKLLMSIGNRRLGTSDDLFNAIEFILQNNYTNGGVLDLTAGINFD